jgi:hypothetical protein
MFSSSTNQDAQRIVSSACVTADSIVTALVKGKSAKVGNAGTIIQDYVRTAKRRLHYDAS